jgi:hypothetical protein
MLQGHYRRLLSQDLIFLLKRNQFQLLKKKSPFWERQRSPIKDDIMAPQGPADNDKFFLKITKLKCNLALGTMSSKIIDKSHWMPKYVQQASLNGQEKRQMPNIFFNALHTKHTCIWRHERIVPIQKISCIDHVSQKKSKEELVFRLHLRTPHPFWIVGK